MSQENVELVRAIVTLYKQPEGVALLASGDLDLSLVDPDIEWDASQISELIPIWVDAGITHLWPFEVQSGMDVLQVRRKYGKSLALMGGIDKRACTRGFDELHREVDRVMPLVEQGGYIPELDHSVPPNISWQNFNEFVRYVKHRMGRG